MLIISRFSSIIRLILILTIIKSTSSTSSPLSRFIPVPTSFSSPSETETLVPPSFISSLPPPSLTVLKNFEIHGWRWHSLSILRDIQRLNSLLSTPSLSPTLLSSRVSYVMDFNLGTLLRVERTIFLPWLTSSLPLEGRLREGMEFLDVNRIKLSHLGSLAMDQASGGEIVGLGRTLDEMEGIVKSNIEVQDKSVVPCIAENLSRWKQGRVNNRILRGLGLLTSRAHLVGMHDAVMELKGEGGERERELWKGKIPKVARMGVKGWRKGVYLDKGGWV